MSEFNKGRATGFNSAVNTQWNPAKINSIRTVRDHVIVTAMEFGERKLASGVLLPSDDGNLSGIHPRWAQVYACGPEQKDVTVGQYILVKHGRWTRGLDIIDNEGKKTIRRVDNDDILMVSNDAVWDETVSEGITYA